MIIEKMDIRTLEAPLATPFRIATGQHDTLKNVFVRLTLSGGARGFGEAAVAPHITGETVERTERNLREAAAVSLGEDVTDFRGFLGAFREKFADNHAGMAALEMAVLDAWARTMGVPLWKLFGAKAVPLRSDITVVIGPLEEARDFARAHARRGFRSFKVKVGRDHALDLARGAAVKNAAPRAGIIIDANQGFDAAGMLRFLKALKQDGIVPLLVEQPVARDDWEGLRRVTLAAAREGVPVCADESVSSLADTVRAVRAGAVSAINIKFMKSGILEAEAMARLARAAGLQLMIGAMMESSLAVTASAHMAAGMGCFSFVDLDTTYFLKGRFAHSPYLDGRGRFDLSRARAGIGVEVRL